MCMLLRPEISFLCSQKNKDAQNRLFSSKTLSKPKSLQSKLTHWRGQICTGWFGNIRSWNGFTNVCENGFEVGGVGHRKQMSEMPMPLSHMTVFPDPLTFKSRTGTKTQATLLGLAHVLLHLVTFSPLFSSWGISHLIYPMLNGCNCHFLEAFRHLPSSVSFLLFPTFISVA